MPGICRCANMLQLATQDNPFHLMLTTAQILGRCFWIISPLWKCDLPSRTFFLGEILKCNNFPRKVFLHHMWIGAQPLLYSDALHVPLRSVKLAGLNCD